MKNRNRKLTLAAGAAAVYLLLLFLLVSAESGAEGATICSIPTAVWYTLTTLTTVGYGDTYPVTAAGRVIGALFQLLSMGLLVVLISTVVSLLRGTLIPMTWLRFNRNKEWFLFPEHGPASAALAKALRERDPDCTVVFSSDMPDGTDSRSGIHTVLSPASLLKMKKGRADTHVFCMGGGNAENERQAAMLRGEDCLVYCMTDHEPDHVPPNEILFNPYECCARLYWHRYPVLSPDETIVMIGAGHYAEVLMEQALHFNVIDPAQHIRYHVIGNLENFRRNHPYLDQICSIDAPADDRDSIFFRDVPWNSDLELLKNASRIILCLRDEERTVSILTQLFRFCPVTGTVYARLSTPFEGVTVFGSPEEIFAPELVMKTALNRTAVRLNDIYRGRCGGSAPCWSDLGSFTRRSNLASADHLSVKVRILLGNDAGDELTPAACRRAYEAFSGADPTLRTHLRAVEHMRWMRFHLLNGWQYAPVRDNARRLHPLLLPFEALSEEDQAKDDYSWVLLKDLAEV